MSAAIDTTLRKARSLTQAGDNASAVDLYLGVLDQFPKNKRALTGLAEATSVTDPGLAQQLNNAVRLAKQLLAEGKTELAITSMNKLVAHMPHLPELHNELGTMYFFLSMGDQAEICYARAHRLNPSHPDFASNFGALLAARGRETMAIDILSETLSRHPGHVHARRALGRAYLNSGHAEAALAAFDTVLATQPDDAECYADRGTAHFSLGHPAAAIADLRRARSLAPTNAEYMRMYCHMANVATDDPVIADLKCAVAESGRDPEDLLRLHFALGDVHHEHGNNAEAFEHWAEANRLHKAIRNYDISQDEARFAQIRDLATQHAAPIVATRARSRRPVFVVGMPRSGTSLLEQMLDCHPQIHGAGELEDFSGALNTVGGLLHPLGEDALRAVRQYYLKALERKLPDVPCIVDKMPLNLQLIPQIRAALPEAAILHIRRDPIATCWSNFRHFYPGGSNSSDFAYDLSDLGRFWCLYNDLMAEWDRLYPGLVLTVTYEDLITDPEPVLRQALDHLDMPWDPTCLAFHENNRPVMTSSADQVRQPLYHHSNAAWETYAPHLTPLRQTLGRGAATDDRADYHGEHNAPSGA